MITYCDEADIDEIWTYMDQHGKRAAMNKYGLMCITAVDGTKFYQ